MPAAFEYGETVAPTTAVNAVKYEYAQQGSAAYSETVPTQAGSYTCLLYTSGIGVLAAAILCGAGRKPANKSGKTV